MQAKDIIEGQIDQLKEKLRLCEFLEEITSWIVEQNGADEEAKNIEISLHQLVGIAKEQLLQGDNFNPEKYATEFVRPISSKEQVQANWRQMAALLKQQNLL